MNTFKVDVSKPKANQLLLHFLEENWKNYLKELKHCRSEFSNEAVHDLRIATRRLIAVIQLLNAVSPRPRLQKIIRIFDGQLHELDNLRDTQVILAEISETIQELPQLQGFQRHQRIVEEKILRFLRKKIRRFNPAEPAGRIRKTHHFIKDGMDHDLESQLLQAVDDGYLIALHRLSWVDPGRPVTIQRVGVVFRAFQSMIETIYPFMDQFPANNLELMYHYQSLMGDIEDAETFMQTLADYFEHTSVSELEPIRSYYGRRYDDAIAAYTREMHLLHQFWRPGPDEPFPWNDPE